GIFPENMHIDQRWITDGRGYTFEPANRSEANKQVERLPKCNIQRSDSFSDRCLQRTFNSYKVFPESFQGCFGKVVPGFPESFFSGQNFLPLNFAFAVVCFLHSSINNFLRWPGNVFANAVALNKRNYRLVRNHQLSIIYF